MSPLRPLMTAAFCAIALMARATVINVGPSDTYAKIEGAVAGDEVVISPGTYRFRVYLTHQGTPENPIRVHAQDPANPPVWDFSSTLVENAPGSYTAGDRGRGGWQVSGGACYQISGIVIQGCVTSSQNSAGLRYYNGATGLLVSNCLFRQNDNGITGGSQESDATVEYCEFDRNGNLSASAPTHNMYIYGGTFALRYCYVHDSTQSQNFHIRARQSFLEYNWFARAANYEGDLMTDDDFASEPGPYSQSMVFRGNIVIQSSAPGNHSQVLALFRDTSPAGDNLSVQVVGNTFAGNGGNAAFVHLSNADGTPMSAVISNNIISGTSLPYLVENSTKGTVSGAGNLLKTGAPAGALTASVFAADPAFANPSTYDFTLASNSPARGAASPLSQGWAPTREYYQNQTNARQSRIRWSARDIGAFESTTQGAIYGPDTLPPLPALIPAMTAGNLQLTWPLTATGFVLETAQSLGPGASWTPSNAASSRSITGVTAAVPISGASAIYRLARRP